MIGTTEFWLVLVFLAKIDECERILSNTAAILTVIQFLTDNKEEIKSKLDEIDRKLENLQNERDIDNWDSLWKGLHLAEKTLKLPASNEDETSFRQRRLERALDLLDDAHFRSDKAAKLNKIPQDVGTQLEVMVRFVQGQCALNISGGYQMAKDCFDESFGILGQLLEPIRQKSKNFPEDIASALAEAEEIRRKGGDLNERPELRREKIVTWGPSPGFHRLMHGVDPERIEETKIVYGKSPAEEIEELEQKANHLKECHNILRRVVDLRQKIDDLMSRAHVM